MTPRYFLLSFQPHPKGSADAVVSGMNWLNDVMFLLFKNVKNYAKLVVFLTNQFAVIQNNQQQN